MHGSMGDSTLKLTQHRILMGDSTLKLTQHRILMGDSTLKFTQHTMLMRWYFVMQTLCLLKVYSLVLQCTFQSSEAVVI